MTFTKLTRTVAIGLWGLTAPLLAQTSKVDQTVNKALAQIDANKPEKAIEMADKLAKEGTAEALLGAARILKHAGKLEEAAANIEKARAAQAAPEIRSRVLAHSAELHVLRGTAKDAVAHAREAVELQQTAESLAMLARAQAHAKEPQAVTTAEKAAQMAPNNAIVQNALGQALSTAGKYTEADAALSKAIQLDPKLYDAYVNRAFLLLNQGKPAEAEAAAQKATEIAPQQGIGFAVLGAAMLAKDPTNPGKAINEAKQAEFLSPHSAYVQYTVGAIFEKMGNATQASAAYRKATEIDPGYAPARVALVKAEFWKGNIDGALAEAKKLAEDNPGDGDAQLLYGRILLKKEDYLAAAEPLERAADLLPNSHEVQALLGAAYQLNKQYVDAADAYKRALELAPNNADYRARYAFVLTQAKRFDAAIGELKKLTAANPNDAAVQNTLGLIYLSMEPKKPLEASIAYKEALKLDPKNAAATYGLGRAHMFNKQYVEAASAFAHAAELDPKIAAESQLMTAWTYLEMAQETKNKEILAKAEAALAKAQAGLGSDPRPAKLRANIERFKKGEAVQQQKEELEKQEARGPDLGTCARNLQAGDAGTRSRAARECASLGAELVPYLLPLINSDPELATRAAVARALGAIGAPAAKACGQLQNEITASAERMVLPPDPKKTSSEDEVKRFGREQAVQSAAREARGKIGCR
jgi:tetratricopeptide (TPR) repeat protein